MLKWNEELLAKAITGSSETIQKLLHKGVQKVIHNERLSSLHFPLPLSHNSTLLRLNKNINLSFGLPGHGAKALI